MVLVNLDKKPDRMVERRARRLITWLIDSDRIRAANRFISEETS